LEIQKREKSSSLRQTKKLTEDKNQHLEKGFEVIQTRLDFLNKELSKLKDPRKNHHRVHSIETVGSILSMERVNSLDRTY